MKWCIVVCLVLEIALIPVFLRYCWPKKTKKSLVLKMICSLLFVMIGILAIQIKGDSGIYAKLVLSGLCAGWLGDFFLHVYPHRAFQLIGGTAFLCGHGLYIFAYYRACAALFPYTRFFSWPELLAFVLLCAVFLGFLLRCIKLGSAILAILPYAAVIIFMIVKAWSLGIRLLYAGMPGALAVQLLLSTGTVLFLFSDSLLALIEFNNRKGFRMKAVNIATYYAAQVAIACSILFVPA